MVYQPLKLFFQGFGALAQEVSFLLTIEATTLSSFGAISHPYGSSIELCAESQLCIFPVLYGVVIINVLGNVVFLSLYLHSRLHLCGMDADIRVIVGVFLSMVTCLILLCVIWLVLVRVSIVGLIGWSTSRRWVCLGILGTGTAVVLSFILLTLTHGNQ